MHIRKTVERALKQGIDPYIAVACEWDRCEPDEVSDERRREVKNFVFRLFYSGPEGVV